MIKLFAPFFSAANSINELSTPLSLEKGSFGTLTAARDVFLNASGMIVNSNSATIAWQTLENVHDGAQRNWI